MTEGSDTSRNLTRPDGSVDRGAFYSRVQDLTRQQADRRAAQPFVPRHRRGGSAADRRDGSGERR